MDIILFILIYFDLFIFIFLFTSRYTYSDGVHVSVTAEPKAYFVVIIYGVLLFLQMFYLPVNNMLDV